MPCCSRIWDFFPKRLSYVLAFVLTLADTVTDILQVLDYRREQSQTVFILSSIFLGISCLLVVAYLLLLCFDIYHRTFEGCLEQREVDDKKARKLKKWSKIGQWIKCIDTFLQSIPQMCISIYVLALCQGEVHVLQYISLVLSFTTATYGATLMDGLLVEGLEKYEPEKLCADLGLCKFMLCRRSNTFDGVDYVFVFIIKGCALASRAIAIAFIAIPSDSSALWRTVLYLIGCATLLWCPLYLYIQIKRKCCSRTVTKEKKNTGIARTIIIWLVSTVTFMIAYVFMWVSYSPFFTLMCSAAHWGINFLVYELPTSKSGDTQSENCPLPSNSALGIILIVCSSLALFLSFVYAIVSWTRKNPNRVRPIGGDTVNETAEIAKTASELGQYCCLGDC